MPLHILLGEKEYLDGVEISPDEIYAWADKNEDTPKTSAVGFEEASDVVKQIIGTEDEMIIFTISAKMSITGNVFRMVVEELELEDKVSVIDSERVFITHSGCEQEIIDEVYDYLKNLNCFEEILVTRAGGVISSHCGPGTLGVLYMSK